MQSNGTLAAKNGNLIVCDMFGHRVVEVDPATGRVVRVLLDKINGKPIDGPNDLVMDAKGGLYVTDPQFTPEAQKSQPGKQVYYVAPDGTARVVIGPGEYAMPNGVELSPDGKTLYVNNTWQQPGENFVWAYDVAADGSLSNKRQFAMLDLTPEVLEAANPADRFDSGADGTAVDTDGRYYVATRSGVQIFLPDGTYAGTIWVPQYPVSLTFGGREQRRAVHGGRIIRVVDPDQGPRIPSPGRHELRTEGSHETMTLLLPPSSAVSRHSLAGAAGPAQAAGARRTHRPHGPGYVPAVARRARRCRQHVVHRAAQSRCGHAGVQLPASRRDPAGAGIGHHFHNVVEEMFVILDGEAQFTIDGRTATVKGPAGVLCRTGHSHAIYNAGPTPVQWMNLNVSMIAGVYDNFDLGDTRVGAALDPIPTFMTMRLDRALLRAPGARGRGAAPARQPRTPSCRAARSDRRCSRRRGPISIMSSSLRAHRRLNCRTTASARRITCSPAGHAQRQGPGVGDRAGSRRRRDPDPHRRVESVHQHRLRAARAVRDGRRQGRGREDAAAHRRRAET